MNQDWYETDDDWRDAFEVTQPMPDYPRAAPGAPQNPYFRDAPPQFTPHAAQHPLPAPPPPPQSVQHPRIPRQQRQPASSTADERAASTAKPAPSDRSTRSATSSAPSTRSTRSAPKAAPPSEPDDKAKTDDGGFSSGPPKWQDQVPFDETGVLLRPEILRQHAMHAETELMSAIKLDVGGSAAAAAQRPGFRTGAWPRRGLLSAVMLLQAILSLRNNNSVFEDESLYLYSGHLELGHLMFNTSTISDFWTEFSGAPVLYPVVGAVADQIGGLFAARLLSLLFMLATTGLLYAITRRLFGTRAGLCAAGLYSCGEATIFLGGLATYDAPALFLIALSVWIVVRFARTSIPICLLAVFPAALAAGTKYVSLLFLPSIVVLALLVSLPHLGRWAVLRPIALTLGLSATLYALYKMGGPSAAEGISSTTTSRAQGTDSVGTVLRTAVEWGADLFVVALAGAVCVIRLPRRHGHPAVPGPGWQRVSLALLLLGTALLAPLYQAHLHTTISLQKHIGFGLFFAAPLAGYGLVQVVGPHLHRVQLGIGVLILNFALGMTQSLQLFHSWPSSSAMASILVRYQQQYQHYLVGNASNAIYELRGDPDALPWQFTDAFYFQYEAKPGVYVTGETAYADAIRAGYFRVIAYDFSANAAVEQSIAEDLYHSESYVMVARIPEQTSSGPGYGYVWVRKW